MHRQNLHTITLAVIAAITLTGLPYLCGTAQRSCAAAETLAREAARQSRAAQIKEDIDRLTARGWRLTVGQNGKSHILPADGYGEAIELPSFLDDAFDFAPVCSGDTFSFSKVTPAVGMDLADAQSPLQFVRPYSFARSIEHILERKKGSEIPRPADSPPSRPALPPAPRGGKSTSA